MESERQSKKEMDVGASQQFSTVNRNNCRIGY